MKFSCEHSRIISVDTMSGGRHLAKGSAKPELPADDTRLRLYSMRYCPFAQRVHLVLDAKGIPYHSIWINLSDKPDWLFDVSPQGKVPALELINEPDAPTLTESLIICEYLDERYTERTLYPKDALKKAEEKILIEKFGPVIGAFFRASDGGSMQDFWNALESFEQLLRTRGTVYFGGEQAGILDYMIWPWCERLELLRVQRGDEYVWDETRFEKLTSWLELMKQDAAVQANFVDAETQAEFLRTRAEGKPVYDQQT